MVDDDASIRALLHRVLVGAGYEVLEAASGRSALAVLHEGAAMRFIVTDLTMEHGSGGWFLAQLAYEFPELLRRTLVISGDAEGAAAAHLAARWRCPVLAKPFSVAQLVDTLHGMEAGSPDGRTGIA